MGSLARRIVSNLRLLGAATSQLTTVVRSPNSDSAPLPGLTSSIERHHFGNANHRRNIQFHCSGTDVTKANSSTYQASGSFSITISPCAPTLTPASVLPSGEVGQPYSQTITSQRLQLNLYL